MDHADIRPGTAERYVLDEMPNEERERFEEHVFDCSICAEDVRVTAVFLDNMKAVLREPLQMKLRGNEETGGSRRRPSQAWLPAQVGMAAAVGLLAIVSYQNTVTIPGMRRQLASADAPRSFSPHFLSPTRSGPVKVVRVPEGQDRVSLEFDKIPGTSHRLYRCELQDAGGRRLSSFHVGVPEGDAWQLMLPVAGRPAGRYILSVAGADSQDGHSHPIAQYHFNLEWK